MTEATSTDRFGSMPHVGRNVRALRLHRGMTLDHLAARAGMRIASRLGGACERIQMGGVDRRLS